MIQFLLWAGNYNFIADKILHRTVKLDEFNQSPRYKNAYILGRESVPIIIIKVYMVEQYFVYLKSIIETNQYFDNNCTQEI